MYRIPNYFTNSHANRYYALDVYVQLPLYVCTVELDYATMQLGTFATFEHLLPLHQTQTL